MSRANRQTNQGRITNMDLPTPYTVLGLQDHAEGTPKPGPFLGLDVELQSGANTLHSNSEARDKPISILSL